MGYMLKAAIRKNLKYRFFSQDIDEEHPRRKKVSLSENKIMNLSMLLDVRFKDRYLLLNKTWHRRATDWLVEEVTNWRKENDASFIPRDELNVSDDYDNENRPR